MRSAIPWMRVALSVIFLIAALSPSFCRQLRADELDLKSLTRDALKNNPEILAAQSRSTAYGHRISQVKSLPDPMISFGYQNEGFKGYTYGESTDAQWQYSASQTFPFPGKRSLRGEVASAETETSKALAQALKFRVAAKIRDLYYDLFMVYINLDVSRYRAILLARIEDIALGRYEAGVASQQEVVMAQTEKYMLSEKETMLKQRIQSLESMINQTAGREIKTPVGRPAAPVFTRYGRELDDLLKLAQDSSPEIRGKQKVTAGAEAKVNLARKEALPDFTVSAGYAQRGGGFQDMWNLSTSLSIPLYYWSKQGPAFYESQASLQEAKYDLEATKLMVASVIRDNFSMIRSSETLAELYKKALIPKASLEFELVVSDYEKGKIEALAAMTRLKTLLDFELLYWNQLAEHEKAIGRIEAVTGIMEIE